MNDIGCANIAFHLLFALTLTSWRHAAQLLPLYFQSKDATFHYGFWRATTGR